MRAMLLLSIVSFIIITNSLISTCQAAASALKVDVYTQKYPYNGMGPNEPSDPFLPNEQVILYAYVTYNNDPICNTLVTFSVYYPNGTPCIISTKATNESGVASLTFRIPPTEKIFGEWTVYAVTSLGIDIKAYDTLSFKVSWIVKIEKIETLDENLDFQEEFKKESYINIRLNLKNIAFESKDVMIAVSIFDAGNRCIINQINVKRIFPGTSTILLNGRMIPLWASTGKGLIIVNLYDGLPKTGGNPLCPSESKEIIILNTDIAITEFSVSPVSAEIGTDLEVNLKIKNEGQTKEIFEVYLYANRTLICIPLSEELDLGEEKIIAFNISTTNMKAGLYLFKAQIPPLKGENDIIDNQSKEIAVNLISKLKARAWGLFIILLVIILILLSIILSFILIKRRRKEKRKGYLAAVVNNLNPFRQ